MGNFELAPDNGSCKGHPVEWWFPNLYGLNRADLVKARANIKMAVQICNVCEVAKECLEYSLRHEPWGIWGGLNEEERAHLRSKKSIMLSRDGRINFAGIGLRNANGNSIKETTNDDSII
jgi:hypothetical protein